MSRWIPLAALLMGCGPVSVSGVVDGERVGGARSAIFDNLELFGTDTVLVLLTDIPDACKTYEEIFEALATDTCDDRCDNLKDVADERLGRKGYWSVVIGSFTTGSVEDTYDYEQAPGNDEFNLLYQSWDVQPLYDTNSCEEECEDGDLLDPDEETGNSGELEIVEYDSKDFVKGRFEVDMGGDEELRGSFNAEHCDMVDWIPWL